jgi:diguanylate cyclase (GGDEF)-like protein
MRLTVPGPRFGVLALIAYALVLLAGVALAVWIALQSGRAEKAADDLARRQAPTLREAVALKSRLAGIENALYEYYATRDRRVFQERFAAYDRACVAGVAILRGVADGNIGAVLRTDTEYENLRALARELDGILASSEVNWDWARAILRDASLTGRKLEASLDELVDASQTELRRSALDAREAARRTAWLVGLYVLAMLAASLLLGVQVRAYVASRSERRQLFMFPERNPNPVLRVGTDGEVIYANPSAARLLLGMGLDPRAHADLLPPNYMARFGAFRASGREYERIPYNLGDRNLEAMVQWLPDLKVFHVYMQDVTERKRAEDKLVFQAYHDTLTALPNRQMFMEHLTQLLPDLDKLGSRGALLLMGMDRFKVVIGSHGHGVGDQVTRAVAQRLVGTLSSCGDLCRAATLYRFEGSQFGIFLPLRNRDQTHLLLAERLIEQARAPLFVGGQEFFVGLSLGIATYPEDGRDVIALLKNADTALTRAKDAGGGALQCYTGDMNARAAEWLRLENFLRHAVEKRELEMHYQPQADAHGRVVGMEALVRWRHPERGLLSPAEFVPLAEESGLVAQIGEWTLEQSCRDTLAWIEQGHGDLSVAVNLSGRQFHAPDLVARIAAILDRTGLPSSHLELEITESVAMRDVEQSGAVLRQLRAMGVRIAIDDFGTGMSSLAYLQRFALDKLKIDQSFTRRIPGDKHGIAIVQAIVTLGHSLGLKVLAEGVEREDQWQLLRDMGCDLIQGHLLSGALSAEAFGAFLDGVRPVLARS